MSISGPRIIGVLLIVIGVCIAVLSQKIVFPGFENVLGIETIVGHENVVYEQDGSYRFTNPGAMIRWTVSVAMAGVTLACGGGWLLCRGRGPGSRERTGRL